MRKKRTHVASLDQVKVTRDGEYAIIEYADADVSTTNFKIGPKVTEMNDQQILDLFNETLEARDQFRREYEHVAVEIPIGQPQISYFEKGGQWTPRGGVLRCVIHDGGPDGEPTIDIDDRELSLREFGGLLCTYAGWGMRIVFVPDDETHEQPTIEVREPENEE